MPLPAPTLPLRPIARTELADAIEAAILAGADGRMSRGVEVFMASCCAPVLADRLMMAGLVVMRLEEPEGL